MLEVADAEDPINGEDEPEPSNKEGELRVQLAGFHPAGSGADA